MESQARLAPYVGLGTRLQDFAPDELSALTEERQVTELREMVERRVMLGKRRRQTRGPSRASARFVAP